MDVNAPGAQGRTALHRALGAGHLELCQYLFDSGADAKILDAVHGRWQCP